MKTNFFSPLFLAHFHDDLFDPKDAPISSRHFFTNTIGVIDSFNKTIDEMEKFFEAGNTYPPYNLVKTDENTYAVSLAVAGFSEKDLTVEVKDNVLSIKGKIEKTEEDQKVQYVSKNIATRQFSRRFLLDDYMEVSGAKLDNGMLTITIVRNVPEEAKPKAIPITKA